MHGRNIAAILALAGLGCASLNASTGYLAMVGPSPMRFQPPPRTERPPTAEPAPAAEPAKAAAITVAPEPESTPVDTLAQRVSVPPPVPASLIVSNTIVDFVNGMRPDSQYVPPSVLVRYFTGHPGDVTGSVAVPVGFRAPDAQPAPVRSSASYEKGP
jgi:hypothetical protein